ncbi:MAG: hypothetical protein JWO67_4852 [Streptosporangiaceae bacterium]|nr:hypothetical protein [Streptosporangiaceae bacterium]
MPSDLELSRTEVGSGQGPSQPAGMPPIQTVNHLRRAITMFRRTRPDDRKKLAGHIRDRANDLNAEDLPWVDAFLRSQNLDKDANNEAPDGADDNPSSDTEPSNAKKFRS